MTDRDRPTPPEPPHHARLPTPAREGAPPGRPSSPRDEPEGTPPQPARAARPEAAGPPPSAPESDIEQVTLDIDGTPWVVRVLGRAGQGASVEMATAAPLLVLGFYRSEESEAAEREALVVGRTLVGLSQAQLESAFAKGRARGPSPPADNAPERARGGRGSGTGGRGG